MRAPSYNQLGVQSPVNVQVDWGSRPGWLQEIGQVRLYTATRPDFSDQTTTDFPVNSTLASIALQNNTVYYWRYNIHWTGLRTVGLRVQQAETWTPLSEVWSFRTATNSGQLPPSGINYNQGNVNLPPTEVSPNPAITDPNKSFASLFGGLTEMKTTTWIVIAVVAVAVWYFFLRK